MSDLLPTFTCCIAPRPIPTFKDFESLDRYIYTEHEAVAPLVTGVSSVYSSSRNGRAVWAIGQALALMDLPALAFLGGKTEELDFGFYKVQLAVLSGAELDTAIVQLNALLDLMVLKADAIAHATDGVPEHFAAARTANYVPEGPRMDVGDVTHDDEGYEDEFTVALVQGVLAVCVNAKRHGLAVAHHFSYI